MDGDFDIFQEAVMAVESLLLLITSSTNDMPYKYALKVGNVLLISITPYK